MWLEAARGGQDRQLTFDGMEGYSYGTIHDQIETFAASRRRAGLPEPLLGVRFSPDGRYLLVLRYDVRPFRHRLILTEYLPPEGGPPIAHDKQEAAADDPAYPSAELSVISIIDGSRRIVPVDPHLFDDVARLAFNAGFLSWDMQRQELWLLGARRGGFELQMLHVDLIKGQVNTLVRETGSSPLVLSPAMGQFNVTVLTKLRRLVWYSERDGWGHLYLYNLDTGKLIQKLTRGPWVVSNLLKVDEGTESLFFTAGGVEAGENPYFRRLYRTDLKGHSPTLITPERADHNISGGHGSISPDGRYVIDDFSTVTQPNRYTLRSSDGALIAPVAEADVSALRSIGWNAPEPFTVKAADKTTDLHGVLYKPQHLDPSKKYPVIEITYPEYPSKYAPIAFNETFYGSAVMNANAMAELGAIVISMDGRGTSYRSAAFRNFVYGNDDVTATIDHVTAIRELGAARSYIDLNWVGITGHSSGGDSSLRSAMRYPDFYKVVVSGEGPTDY